VADHEVKIRGACDMPPMAMSLGRMLYNKTGSWRNIRPVLDQEKCTKCLLCWKFCPDLSIIVHEDENYLEIDYDYCKVFGICAEECNVAANTMEEEK